jgi:hypothetical protein
MKLLSFLVISTFVSLIKSQAPSVVDRLSQVRELNFRLSINCLSCATSKNPYKNEMPSCVQTNFREPTLDTWITSDSGNDFFFLTQSFRDYVGRLEKYLIQQKRLTSNPFDSRCLQFGYDPSIVIISSSLVYNPIYFYQSIIYMKNSMYYYVVYNTGMTLSGRRLQSTSPYTNGDLSYPVASFTTRETDFHEVLSLLRIKPIAKGYVTKDFAKLSTLVGIIGSWNENVKNITIANTSDLIAVCGRNTCTPNTG